MCKQIPVFVQNKRFIITALAGCSSLDRQSLHCLNFRGVSLEGTAAVQLALMACGVGQGDSEDLFAQGLCLPSGPCVTDEDVQYIVELVLKLIK